MKIGERNRLPFKPGNLLMLINQRAVRLWKAMRAQPYLVLLFVAILIYGVVFSYFTVRKHDVFQSNCWDLGIFDQALYTTLHSGKFLYYTADLFLNPSGCYFAQHISPILFLILPFYAISSSPITLLVLKSFTLALGALPLYFLAKELLESAKSGFITGIIYLLYAPLQAANTFDFQPQVFLPMLFFSMFYFAIRSKWKLYFVATILAAMVEEHISIFIFLVGLYLLVTSKERPFWKSIKSFRKMNRNLASVITMMLSIIYFFVAQWIKNSFPINPQFMDVYKAIHVFSVLGMKGDPLFFPIYVLLNPQRGLGALMFDFPLKFLFLVFLFGPLLFFSLRSKFVVVTLPYLCLFLLSNYNAYYSIGAHYPLYILAFIFIAALIVLKRSQHEARMSILKTMLIASMLITISVSPLSPLSAPFVEKGLLWYSGTSLVSNENTASLTDIVNVIPPNASVLTQNVIFPHVSSRINAYALPISNVMNNTQYLRSLIADSEYILLDLTWHHDLNTKLVLDEITHNSSFGVYALANNAILFKRGFEGEPLFVHYTEYKVFSAYKDLLTASYSQILRDLSAESEKVVLCPKNLTGCFVFGPYNYMLRGSYEITFTVKTGEHYGGRVGRCDISTNFGGSVVSARDIFGFELEPNKWANLSLVFTSTKLLTPVEFRVFSYGTADIFLDRVVMKRVSPDATSDFGLRMYSSGGLPLASGYASEEGFLVFEQNTTSNTFWYGPYVNLPPGKYKVSSLLKISPLPEEPNEHILTLSLSANSGKDMLARYEVKASDFLKKDNVSDWRKFTFEFIAEDNLKNVEFTGLAPSSNFSIYLAYIAVEPFPSPRDNYVVFGVKQGLQVEDGQVVGDASSHNGEVALSQKGLNEGILTYGPYISLPEGTFKATFRIKTHETTQNATIGLEVTSQQGNIMLSQRTLNSSAIIDGSWFNVTLPFSLKSPTTGIEFRVSSNGMTNLYVDTVTVLYP